MRSATSLIQVAGRAARNVNSQVVMYADTITGSMKTAIDETDRRRKNQVEFNKKNNITPKTVRKEIKEGIENLHESEIAVAEVAGETLEEHELHQVVADLQHEMEVAARNLQFEKAAYFRDQIEELESTGKGRGEGKEKIWKKRY